MIPPKISLGSMQTFGVSAGTAFTHSGPDNPNKVQTMDISVHGVMPAHGCSSSQVQYPDPESYDDGEPIR